MSRIAAIEPCGDDGAIVALEPERDVGPVRASRFFMLRREDGASPLLPRPFSIYRQRGGRLEFLIKDKAEPCTTSAAERPALAPAAAAASTCAGTMS